uniref:Uncharacterized protein n=1 Tax=Craspedostauros australis TaxID=1486917 RepID=A0A7R9WXA3_9STRA|mmetsp:Transcript_21885/g.60942  ORF Transcript_21885/g.60942 Transcript_21885/m.60942 type:complete len:408 (+) Transcript_21885:285-1508(+)
MMNSWAFPGAGGMGGYRSSRRFEEQYHCYSVAYADKSHLEKGDKILLPPSAFDQLARLQVDYPMLFRLTSTTDTNMTHCGVLEFTAEEGTCYIPFWMMQNLLIEEGAVITVSNVSLPKATFVKLQPQHVDFLEISNPRAVLEHALRNFSCVTKGDVIQIPYNNKNFHFALKEVEPQDAACIIETDCNVDFDAPVGYQEPNYNKSETSGPGSTGDARSSQCPSPTTLSTASSIPSQMVDDETSKPKGTQIIDGKILRPDEDEEDTAPQSKMLAKRTGATGVQKNAAIPEAAPEVDYWAVVAGDGARLDGKKNKPLKDKDGNEVDIRQLRAEAAARREKEMAERMAKSSLSSTSGKLLADGADAGSLQPEAAAAAKPAPAAKRKSRIGSKFSRLKNSGTAFQGSSNTMK